MDRQGFLSSMPFLLPCPSAAWPPRRSTGASGCKSTRVETMLPVSKDSSYKFKLSLEPAVATSIDGQQKLEQIQPAFFGVPDDDGSSGNSKSKFDPSIADIQVAVESSVGAPKDSQDDSSVLKGRVLFVGGNINNRNDDSSSTQTPSSHKITPDQMQLSCQRIPDAWPLYLYFRINKERVFQVDGKQLLHVEVVLPESKGKGNLPPCLLLVFSCCIFRIFPLYCPSPTKPATDSDTPKADWKNQALEALRSLEKQFLQLSGSSASTTAAWSPCGSSIPSGAGEGGQKDGGYPTPGGQSHSHSHSHSHSTLTSCSHSNSSRSPSNKKLKNTTEEEDEAKLKENHMIKKAKRRRDALARSRAGLKSVETILGMPMSVCKPDKMSPSKPKQQSHHHLKMDTQAIPLTDSLGSDVAMFKTQGHLGLLRNSKPDAAPDMAMGPLLTGITEDLTNAYGTNAETQEVLKLYQREIEERRLDRMDMLLDSFFPSMPQRQSSSRKNRKSRRSRDTPATDGEKDVAVGTKSAKEVMKSVQRLVQKQRALVEERSSFLQLPTRG